MTIIRFLLGRIILLINLLTLPKKPKHDQTTAKKLNDLSANWSLYQLNACPFCVKVRRQTRRLGVDVELRDIKKHSHFSDELVTQGGKRKVPCLRIKEASGDVRWLYESSDINQYLNDAVAAAKKAA